MKKLFALFAALVMLLSLAACGGSEGGEVVEDPVDNVESEQQVEEEPQKEEEKEPEKELEPIVFTGSGDDVVEIGSIEDGYVFHITGNAADDYFGVQGYDNNNEPVALLVNETQPYDGITLDPTLSTTLLEIQAVGEWTVELIPLVDLPLYSSGDTVTGSGDYVFRTNNVGRTADISGNAADDYFGVIAYGASSSDLLVNESSPYEGTVMIKCDPFLFEVQAVGEWTIILN